MKNCMNNKKKNQTNKRGTPRNASGITLQSIISKLLAANPKVRYSTRQIAKKINVSNNISSIQNAIDELCKRDIIFELKEGRYRIQRTSVHAPSLRYSGNRAKGRVDLTRHGSAFIISEDLEKDIFVPAKHLNSAMNGDIVEVVYKQRNGKRPEGVIIEVIKRLQTHFIGNYKSYKNESIVYIDNYKSHFEVKIPRDKTLEAESGEKVVVEITKWPTEKQRAYWGEVTKKLGKEESNDIEMNTILINNGFMINFPKDVLQASEKLDKRVTENEISKRRDFRGITTFTIDPDTAKDFDDALSIQKLDNGNIEIGVHIADVSHYVKEGTALDVEALKRSTSVYLVDRVAPMLPEVLSNELCSLRPNEDKLCFSAVFEFDQKHNVQKEWFGKTVIHSDRRFTYEEAQEIIENKDGLFAEELLLLNEIALKLRAAKFEKGAISFDSPEMKFKLDESGKPIGIFIKKRKEAHLLIEDFMLLANRRVAAKIGKNKNGAEIPFVYRVHDRPDPDRIAEFAAFALELGYKMNISTPQQISKSFNALTKAAKDDELLRMLEPLAIRTMAKAIYTTDNIGHYGLAFDFYSHFTSPIRRYADVLVHRILEKNLKTPYRVEKKALEEQCVHISTQERKAMDAERESIKYKQIEYLKDRIGENFTGIISGMIDKGIFVEIIECGAEGLIPFSAFNDQFQVDEGRYTAIGKRKGLKLRRGDRIEVKLIETNLAARQIELLPVEKSESISE